MTSTGLTTAELLDKLEGRVRMLRDKLGSASERSAARPEHGPEQPELHWDIPVAPPDPAGAHELRVLLQLAGLSQAAFAAMFQLPVGVVREWVAGERGLPVWVLPSLRMMEHLTPAMQQQAFRKQVRPAGTNRKRNTHPFSRIEEL